MTGAEKKNNGASSEKKCPCHLVQNRAREKCSLDSPWIGEFIPNDREYFVKSLQVFFQTERRGFFAVTGKPGLGKSKLIRKALESESNGLSKELNGLKRWLMPVWVDPNQLRLVENSVDTTSSLKTKISYDTKKVLLCILQALVTQLSPHAAFRSHGKGLRTRLGFWWYYFSWPCHVTRPRNNFTKTIRKGESKPRGLFLSRTLALCILIGLGTSSFYLGTLLQEPLINFLGHFLPTTLFNYEILDYQPSIVQYIFAGGCCTLLSWLLLRMLEWLPIRRSANRLHKLAFAAEYSRQESQNLNTTFKSNLPLLSIKPYMKWVFKQQELAVYGRDVPNLLKELQVLLFQLHRLGIEPLLIIDELDKLDRHGNEGNGLSGSETSGLIWNWLEWNTSNNTTNESTQKFFDILLLFKESLGQHMSTVLVGNLDMANLLDQSRLKGGPYHTMVREQIILGPISLDAWQNAFWKQLGKCPPNCTPDLKNPCQQKNICHLTKSKGHPECRLCDLKNPEDINGQKIAEYCPCFRQWSKLIWLEGKGCYSNIIYYARGYRRQQWLWEDNRKQLQWAEAATDVLHDLWKKYNNGLLKSWVPGAGNQRAVDVIMPQAIMSVMFTLFIYGNILLPINTTVHVPGKRILTFLWEQLHELSDQKIITKTTISVEEMITTHGMDEKKLKPYKSYDWFCFERNAQYKPPESSNEEQKTEVPQEEQKGQVDSVPEGSKKPQNF